ncbi:MAG: hypothetical protein FJW32_25265 [Acidobacteria bacterium]|nr:hypothetical protein [Acidobacteriota bacterium]
MSAATGVMPTTTPDMLDAALAYAARGWPVFPLRPRDKKPATKNGFKDATIDADQIRRWWTQWPTANIGLWCRDFVVLDVDPRHGGDRSLEALLSTKSDAYDFGTLEAVTGGGGRHYVFSAPGAPITKNKLADGIDIKSANGYIVVAPSIHPSGKRYEWIDDELEPAPMPDWLFKLVATDGGTVETSRPSEHTPFVLPAVIAKGVQHRSLHAYGSSLRAKGMEQPEIEAELLIAARRCEDVPPDSHMTRLAASVCKLYKPGLSPAYAARALEAVDFDRTTGWKAKLKASKGGKPKPLLMNADIALRHCPDWEGVFAFDEFRQKVRIITESPIGGEFPRDWSDADDTRTAIWMQGQGVEVGCELVGKAVQALAMENPVHPLRDWLRSLRWDGEPRVDRWLVEYLGAASSDYIRSVGRMWLISAVARVIKPGSKVDHAIVLEARQGAGKSRALRILAGDEYFVDSLPDLHQKDAQMQTFGAWVIELSELDALSRAATTAVKAFLTRQVERLRRPYGHHNEDVPRQCVFAGTTNSKDYLRDETGNRRFWPVTCGRIDCEALARDREQLWAEAVALFDDGATWWPERAELIEAAASEQEARVSVDPWQDLIEKHVSNRSAIKCEDLLQALAIPQGQWTQAHKNRVGRCLRLLGFEPSRTRAMGRCYVKGAE